MDNKKQELQVLNEESSKASNAAFTKTEIEKQKQIIYHIDEERDPRIRSKEELQLYTQVLQGMENIKFASANDILGMMIKLKSAFSLVTNKIDANTWTICSAEYVEVLRDYPVIDLVRCSKVLIRKSKFFPSIAAICEICDEYAAERKDRINKVKTAIMIHEKMRR